MNCTECEQLLQQQLDGEAIADRAAFDAHLVDCTACRARHAAAQRLLDGMRLLVPPLPPEGFCATIVAGVLAQRKARLRRRRVLAAAALAASIILAVVAFARWPGSSGTAWVQERMNEFLGSGEPKIIVLDRSSDMTDAEDGLPTDSGRSLRHSVAEARSAVVSLTQRTADETVGQSRLLLPEALPTAPAPTVDPMGKALDVPAEPFREASQGVSASLEPVTTSARRAVDLFLREILPEEPERKPGL